MPNIATTLCIPASASLQNISGRFYKYRYASVRNKALGLPVIIQPLFFLEPFAVKPFGEMVTSPNRIMITSTLFTLYKHASPRASNNKLVFIVIYRNNSPLIHGLFWIVTIANVVLFKNLPRKPLFLSSIRKAHQLLTYTFLLLSATFLF